MSYDGTVTVVGNQNVSVTDGNDSLIIAGNGNDTLTAGSGSAVIAGNGSDKIAVGADSLIKVGNGNDTLNAGADSVVIAGNGNDRITVGADSAIKVGNGNDTLTAGANSVIIAGNGNDTIYLGANDEVSVGNGKDTFVLPSSAQVSLSVPSSLSVNEDGTIALAIGAGTSGFGFGHEEIDGFNASKDKIQVSTSQFANFAAVMADAKQVGDDTVIKADGADTILLEDVRLSSLTANDFVFVNPSVTVTISGIPADATLTDTAGAITVTNGTATLTQAQLAGLTLHAGEVTSATLTVTATDPGTGNSVSKTIALSVNPVAPTLKMTFDTVSFTDTGVQGDHLTNNGSVTFSGTLTDSVAVSKVQVFNAGTLLGTATVDNVNHTWTLTTTLGEGNYSQLTATATDTGGNSANSNTTQYVQIDTTGPTVGSQSESAPGLTNSNVETITVNATDANGVASVEIYDDVTKQDLGSATPGTGTSWSLTTSALSEGNHQFHAVVTDKAGNTTTTTDLATVTVDTTPPAASISVAVTGPTNQTSESINVSATDANGIKSVVIDDNGSFLANATQTATGVWTYAANNLASGAHDFTAVVTDDAGNVTVSKDAAVLVDTMPPSVTLDTVSYDQTGTAANFTKDGTVTFSGTTSDNVTVSKVEVFSGTQLLGSVTPDNTNHTWTLTESLSQGTYANLNVVAIDEAGNTAAASNTGATQTVQVDTTPPTVTFDSVSITDTGVAGDGITANSLVTMSGSVGDDVTVSQVQVFSGTQLLGNATVDSSTHTWTLQTNLADGNYGNLTAKAIDEAGNSSTAGNSSATQSVQIDTAPPVITFDQVSLSHPADASGTTSNDGGVTLSGTVADNVSVSQVEIFNGTQSLGVANVTNGTWTLQTTLDQGTYNQLHATATDEAGNTGDAATKSIVNVTPESGYVIDGYIQGATVFADTNGNGKLDPGEASGVTDASGHFVLGAGTTSGTLVLIGGTDTATGLTFTGVMTAPSGSTQVTPLTTLVQSVAAANGGDVAAASQSVATALGLDPSVNLTSLDTVAAAYQGDSSAFVAASKVLNTVSMVASAVAGTGVADVSSAASGAFSALATQIVTSGTLDLNNSTVVSTVVSNTLTSVTSSSSTALTSDQTAGIASVVTSVNQATDQAVSSSSGGTTADLLTNVSATSIVAQGSASSQLQQATAGSADLSTVVANNSGASLTNSVQSATSQVGSVAPAAPTFVGLTPTDSSPNNGNVVHYLLAFSDPVTGVNASDFSLATTGLTGASIASITPVTGSNGTQYVIAVNAGSGDGTLALNFTGTTVQDVANNPFQDVSTHTGAAYTIDQDTTEQSALGLAVTNTQVNSAGSAVFTFTVAGLEPEDTGIVTFTDGQNVVSVPVSGAQTTYRANLSALSDGPITSQLSVNNDPVGNSFTPVAGTSAVTLTGFNAAPGGGIAVIQNGAGDITVVPSSSIVNQAGNGVLAEQSATGVGNIVVTTAANVTGTGTGSVGLLAENLNAANNGNITVIATGGASGGQNAIQAITQGNGNIAVEAGGAVNATTLYGIRVQSYGTGDLSATTDLGSTINSGGAGINLVNFDSAIAASANSTITVTNNATINSGTTSNGNGTPAQGIVAGYYGGTPNGTSPGIVNQNVNGTVVVNNNGNITAAAGYGIDAYNWGNGDVTVNEAANTSVSGGQYGIAAYALSKGSGSVAVNVGANANITGTSLFGIQAFTSGVGNMAVTTGDGDVITGGSIAINAQSQTTSEPASGNITVIIGNDTIHSGTLNTPNGGSTPGAISVGFAPNGLAQTSNTVAGNVTVQNNATVVADKGAGINAYNWGTGNVAVTTGVTSSISAAAGNGIQANALNGGNASVTNGGTVSGTTGIFAGANQAGNIAIENDGQVSATSFSGINVSQATPGSTGSTTITNTGTVVGAANHSAINVSENSAGTVTINNSGTIGASATGQAISENGGTVVVNNSGNIVGSVNTSNTGAFTGTFHNNAGATWQAGFIGDDGTITASGAGSAITVVGASSGIGVGDNATGSLTLSAGAALTADWLNIGNAVGSHGTVLVTGAGSSVDTTAGQIQNIGVGFDGTASLTIADHALVATGNMDVAINHDAGVTDTLDLNNATLNIGQGLTIGDAGTAHATVENGGIIDTGFLAVANQASGVGTLTVDGAGSVVTVTNGMNLGSSGGSATLTVSNGGAIDIGSGTATISDAIHVGSSGNMTGAGVIHGDVVNDGGITVSGGTLDIVGNLGGSGSTTINAGATLEVTSGVAGTQTIVFAASTGMLSVDHAAGLQATISGFTGDGTLAGSDQIDLKDINYNSVSETFDAATDTLTVSDGTNSTTLHFVGTYQALNFKLASDGAGGTIVYDPPVSSAQPGPAPQGSDSFVFNFAPNGGAAEPAYGDLHHLGNAQFAAVNELLNGHEQFLVAANELAQPDLASWSKSLASYHDFHGV